jgi:hypothetical protein
MGLTEIYEHNQSYNIATRWLHSLRYRHVLEILDGIRQPFRLLDIGCGPCKLYEVVNSKFDVEVEPNFIQVAQARHSHKPNFRLVAESIMQVIDEHENFDVICALETLEHMPRQDVRVLLDKVAARRSSLFMASVPVEIGPSIWLKNVGSALCGYSRHEEYTWTETFWAGLYRLDKLPPHGTDHKGFDWRWLRSQMVERFPDIEVHKLPFPVLPPSSVLFVNRGAKR